MQINAQYFTVGIDMRCKKVISKVTLLELRPANDWGSDCVIKNAGGTKVMYKTSMLYTTRAEAEIHLN